MKKVIRIENIEETNKLADMLAKVLDKGDIITLDGDLGAGKTTFTKELAKALGVTANVTSPTFNIMKIYDARDFSFYHLDVYRLNGIGLDFDLEEYIYSDGVSVIEWSDNIKEIFDDTRLRIDIRVIDETRREFTLESKNEKFFKILEA